MKLLSVRVKLEPGLEERARAWSPSKRLLMADLFERWARQLRVSARMIETQSQPRKPRRYQRFPELRILLRN